MAIIVNPKRVGKGAIKMPIEGYRVLKVLNNNVVLTVQSDREKILFSKGIGFDREPGDMIGAAADIEKTFTIENRDNYDKFNQIVANVDSRIVGLSEEIIYMIDRELGGELDEQIHTARNRGKLSNTIKTAFISNTAAEMIEDQFLGGGIDCEIPPKPISGIWDQRRY